MNRRVLVAGLIITVPIVAVLLANLGRNPHRVKSPLIGRSAPGFSLKEAGGDRIVSLQQFRGRPVIVNFWSTWCVPCYAEHEVLVSSAARLGDSVQFLGIVYEDTEEKIGQFLRQNGSAYPSLMDEAGRTAIAYGIAGVPETFFINADGTIVDKFEGPLDAELLAERVRRAMSTR